MIVTAIALVVGVALGYGFRGYIGRKERGWCGPESQAVRQGRFSGGLRAALLFRGGREWSIRLCTWC